jgi:hypothetical protein
LRAARQRRADNHRSDEQASALQSRHLQPPYKYVEFIHQCPLLTIY